MIFLELFSGQGALSKTVRSRGHKAFTVDWSDKIDSDLKADVSKLTFKDIVELCGRVPDVVWASPQCTTYSIATHHHRTLREGAKTSLAKQDDAVNYAMWALIYELLAHGCKYFFVENPRGRMRNMPFVQGKPRYTISYCAYGSRGNATGYSNYYCMKPTDIWTNHPNPNFRELCKGSRNGHLHGDWGKIMRRDYLSRGQMPDELVDDLVSLFLSSEGMIDD